MIHFSWRAMTPKPSRSSLSRSEVGSSVFTTCSLTLKPAALTTCSATCTRKPRGSAPPCGVPKKIIAAVDLYIWWAWGRGLWCLSTPWDRRSISFTTISPRLWATKRIGLDESERRSASRLPRKSDAISYTVFWLTGSPKEWRTLVSYP